VLHVVNTVQALSDIYSYVLHMLQDASAPPNVWLQLLEQCATIHDCHPSILHTLAQQLAEQRARTTQLEQQVSDQQQAAVVRQQHIASLQEQASNQQQLVAALQQQVASMQQQQQQQQQQRVMAQEQLIAVQQLQISGLQGQLQDLHAAATAVSSG
jgi:DNA anti-recombination protein RmuC